MSENTFYKYISVKSTEKKYYISRFARDSLNLLRTPVRANFVFAPTIYNDGIAFWVNVYPSTTSGPPGEFITGEKFISRE